jgi:hypothetical protein
MLGRTPHRFQRRGRRGRDRCAFGIALLARAARQRHREICGSWAADHRETRGHRGIPKRKWGPALLPAPTAPSEGSAGVRNLVHLTRRPAVPALDPGSPAQASLPIEPLPLARSPTGLPKRRPGGSPSLSTRPAWRWKPKLPAKTVRCSAALLGSIPLGVPLCSPPRKASSRVALEKIDSSGASYRLTAPPLRRALASPAGGDRTFGHLPLPPAVAGSWRGRDRRPDHLLTLHRPAESQKRKIR